MAGSTSTCAPDDVATVVIADVPVGGLAVSWRGFEILESPSNGVLVVRTIKSGENNRPITHLYATYEHVLQVTRIMPSSDGTTVTRVRGWL